MKFFSDSTECLYKRFGTVQEVLIRDIADKFPAALQYKHKRRKEKRREREGKRKEIE